MGLFFHCVSSMDDDTVPSNGTKNGYKATKFISAMGVIKKSKADTINIFSINKYWLCRLYKCIYQY